MNSFQELKTLKDNLEQAAKIQDAKRQEHFAKAKKVSEFLQATYPTVFNAAAPLPLAVGIEKSIRQAHPDLVVISLRFALSIWTKREKYLEAVIQGNERFHLDGSVSGPIKASEREFSQILLAKKKAQRKSNKHRFVKKNAESHVIA